jgi:hypothetical protein
VFLALPGKGSLSGCFLNAVFLNLSGNNSWTSVIILTITCGALLDPCTAQQE